MSTNKPALGRFTEHVQGASPRSRRVGLIAGYYRLTAMVGALGFAVTVMGAVANGTLGAAALAHPLAFVFAPLNIAASWWTGQLIGDRRRDGAWMAIGSISMGVLDAVIRRQPGAAGILVLATVGLAAITSIWKELE